MADSELDNSNAFVAEEAVGDFLSATLEGQVGKSEARFREFLSEHGSRAGRPTSYRLPNRFSGWTFGLVGAALAASLAALWAGPSFRQVVPQTPVHFTSPADASLAQSPLLVQQDVQSQTFDDGTYMTDDDTPVRILRRHDLERTRWFDHDDNVRGEEVVPQDHVVLVHMKTY